LFGILKKSVFKTIIYLIVLLSLVYFIVVQGFLADFHWDIFLYSPSFVHFVIEFVSSSENRSSFNLFVHYHARQGLLVFLRFLGALFLEKSPSTCWKSNRFHRC
jgi:hypothetical protein